ncbi:MAG: PAS domain S-box protein [Gracilimonas sp.]|uniref:histidine kinase dimerization/phosphoacceptor domain -containing protein n=1 Tax=Gracilimonas TaxID=649462 RepID=UPI001B2883D9|nr:histidine kinase dimerization/phosphoacceptor domain -containing protein [Gracilimonas sp.]MBO6587151.1 PAS domain S-box protein [Gracilimonas sp.]MBO6614361.1 PAS domain S-box protein [Gracilimonas sp.]
MKQLFEKYRFISSALIGVVLSVIVILLWVGNKSNIEQSQENKVKETAQLVTLQFKSAVHDNINTLLNLKSRLEITGGSYFDFWEYDAGRMVNQDSSFLFVEWIDSSMVIRKVEPLEPNKNAIGLDISKLDYRRTDWLQAKEDSVVNVTHWLKLVQGPDAFLVDAPVYYNGVFQGTITAGMDFNPRFDLILQGLDQYRVKIYDSKGKVFYQHGDSTGISGLNGFSVEEKITLEGTNKDYWLVSVSPNAIFEAENNSSGLYLNLAMGIVLSILFSVIFYFMQTAFAAQKSSLQANDKIRALIESSPMAIYTIDTDGIVRDFWNKAAEDMLGWSQKEAIGTFMPHVGEELKEDFFRLMSIIFKNGEIKNKEIVRYRKDGSPIHMRVSASHIVGNNSESKQMLIIAEDITTEAEYKKQLEDSVHEKEVLLSEVHHRVKNNLAIIAGLIELQKEGLSDEKLQLILKETQNRIYSISGVHELLYNTDSFTDITFGEYAVKLIDRIRDMFDSSDKSIVIEHQFDSRRLNINQAIPLGLLMNELITNSFKHAFNGRNNGRIFISLKENGDLIEVVYEDDGKGFDKDIFDESNTLGVTLIKTLIDQLTANYEIESDNGFRFSFSFEVKGKGAHSNL